jgi:serine/threonine protein kinase
MLEAMNKLGIVHRNIKPENIIMTKNGYPKLIDFSCSKIIETNKTRTIVGTPFYISPEVLRGAGYSYSCDYWGLGVLFFFMFFGEYPFGTRSSPPDKVYEEIINKKLIFNENLTKKFNGHAHKIEKLNELKEVIEILLTKNDIERMKKVENIKQKKFFEHIDFDKLKKMEMKAPFIPQINNYEYQKELKNTSKPFMDFSPEPAIKLKNSVNDATVIYREKKENYLEYHKNLMRWFEKF